MGGAVRVDYRRSAVARKALLRDLRGNELVPLVALRGHEGLAVAGRARPSLVIVDILLPDLDGREVITQLRGISHNETTPIIAISAVSDRAMESDCLAAGADVFLSKPVGVAHFSRIVEQLLAPAPREG